MPYVDFKNISNSEQFNDYWELRIHINPSALGQKNNNQIKVIQSILEEVFGNENVGLKIYSISDIKEKENEYDGALSHSGKDRTQVGKEVGILLPDSIVSQLTTEQYKNKLLLLWRKLQEKNVPLMYMNLPGDKSICVANNLPSPFSFTSNNPNKKEGNEKHGILFKEFTPNGKHPILKVNFSLGDIIQHKIKLNSDELQRTIDYLNKHKKEVYKDIKQQIKLLGEQDLSYKDILFDDDKSVDLIKKLIKKYKDEVESIEDLKKRGEAQIKFSNELALNDEYQFLIYACPHESDKDFIPMMPPMQFAHLTDEKATQIISDLRKKFDTTIDDITKDFESLDGKLPFEEKELKDLIKKNPAQMQSIYRQLALIQQEERLNKEKHPAIVLLTAYKNNRENTTSNEYFSFFGSISRLFGAYSKKEKFEAVDALIKSIHDPNYKLDKRHLGPLNQGQVQLIIKDANINLTDYLDPLDALSIRKKW